MNKVLSIHWMNFHWDLWLKYLLMINVLVFRWSKFAQPRLAKESSYWLACQTLQWQMPTLNLFLLLVQVVLTVVLKHQGFVVGCVVVKVSELKGNITFCWKKQTKKAVGLCSSALSYWRANSVTPLSPECVCFFCPVSSPEKLGRNTSARRSDLSKVFQSKVRGGNNDHCWVSKSANHRPRSLIRLQVWITNFLLLPLPLFCRARRRQSLTLCCEGDLAERPKLLLHCHVWAAALTALADTNHPLIQVSGPVEPLLAAAARGGCQQALTWARWRLRLAGLRCEEVCCGVVSGGVMASKALFLENRFFWLSSLNRACERLFASTSASWIFMLHLLFR